MGVLHKNVSKIFVTIDFSSGQIANKTLSVRKNFTGYVNLGQTSHLNLEKSGIDNFAQTHIVYKIT